MEGMEFLPSGSQEELYSQSSTEVLAAQPSPSASMLIRAGHHRRRSSLSTFFGSLTGHSKGNHHLMEKGGAVLAQNPMFSTRNTEDEDFVSGSNTDGSGRYLTPAGLVSNSGSEELQQAAAAGGRQPFDLARQVAARANKVPHPSGDSSMFEGFDMSMSSVLEDSPTPSLNATAVHLTDASCLTSRTNVSNFSSWSGTYQAEGDQSVIIHSSRSSQHRLSYAGMCTDGTTEQDSVGEIQNMKSQLEDMGKRFDYLEHWLGECQTPRHAAISSK